VWHHANGYGGKKEEARTSRGRFTKPKIKGVTTRTDEQRRDLVKA